MLKSMLSQINLYNLVSFLLIIGSSNLIILYLSKKIGYLKGYFNGVIEEKTRISEELSSSCDNCQKEMKKLLEEMNTIDTKTIKGLEEQLNVQRKFIEVSSRLSAFNDTNDFIVNNDFNEEQNEEKNSN